jgi:hypothetical protein
VAPGNGFAPRATMRTGLAEKGGMGKGVSKGFRMKNENQKWSF